MRHEARFAAGLLAALHLGLAGAQLLGNPDTGWRDEAVPPPPALRTTGLLPIDVGGGTTLRFGVDPTSVSITPEGVVRYVVVATSPSGAVNAMYEGLRCGPAMARVYARHDAQRGWVPAQGEWRPLELGTAAARHSLAIAQQGACKGPTPNSPVAQLLRDLGSSGAQR